MTLVESVYYLVRLIAPDEVVMHVPQPIVVGAVIGGAVGLAWFLWTVGGDR